MNWHNTFNKIKWWFQDLTLEKIAIWFHDLPANIKDWFGKSYDWVTEAVTGWDMELDDFKDQISFMFFETINVFRKVANGISSIKREFSELVREFLKGFRGWR